MTKAAPSTPIEFARGSIFQIIHANAARASDPIAAPQVEAWAGLRPATADRLPLIGALPGSMRQWIAGGHYRNGILLAPATATVLADLLEHKPPAVDLQRFMGRWYVIANIPYFAESGYVGSYVEYEVAPTDTGTERFGVEEIACDGV